MLEGVGEPGVRGVEGEAVCAQEAGDGVGGHLAGGGLLDEGGQGLPVAGSGGVEVVERGGGDGGFVVAGGVQHEAGRVDALGVGLEGEHGLEEAPPQGDDAKGRSSRAARASAKAV